MLTLENVSCHYPDRPLTLRDVSLELSPRVTLLAGPNASGKTTLLRLLAGLLEPDSGTVTLAETNAPVTTPQLRETSRMLMQDPDPQILGATAREDVMLGSNSSNLPDFAEAASRLGERFGLTELWDESVDSLSYGQKRKLCLLHALLAGPKLLLLDEPFAGLDYPGARELRTFLIENMRNGVTQVISTHELEPVWDLADHMVVVSGGTVAASGSPAELGDGLARWGVRAPGKGWD